MRIGYACLTLGVPGTAIRSLTLARATEEALLEVTAHNLDALETLLEYNRRAGVRLFRMSSDLVPFGSGGANALPWDRIFGDKLAALGRLACESGIRLSMHPGQYTVLNSPRAEVCEAALDDLEYHNRFMDAMGLPPSHKIILHGGGGYGDKEEAVRRFAQNFRRLSTGAANRLVLENDERIFNIEEILSLSEMTGLPVVFDLLHHQVNPPATFREPAEWIRRAAATWSDKDGPPKLHYSQQDPGKKPGAHSPTIALAPFLEFAASLPEDGVDVMLEVKDKNLSAVKCIKGLSNPGHIRVLEEEWGRYKYNVLEHAPAAYQAIRNLLKDKNAYPVLAFYNLLDQAIAAPVSPGNAVNAAAHVWGYFKDKATDRERRRFLTLAATLEQGAASPKALKNHLGKLSKNYPEPYLEHSYYFTLP